MTNDAKQNFYQSLERFKIALETRNFEIELFWKRCNYFLVLNTALAVGIFLLFREGGEPPLLLLFLIFLVGIFVCIAWIMVGYGSKYWQAHWEQVVIREQEHIGFHESEARDYFGLDNHQERVAANLRLPPGTEKEVEELPFPQFIWKVVTLSLPWVKEKEENEYKKLFLQKPSVSDWMHKTAVFFLLAWVAMLVLGILWALLCYSWGLVLILVMLGFIIWAFWKWAWLCESIRALWRKICG